MDKNEIEYLGSKSGSFIAELEEEMREIPGSNIRYSDKYKMRLYEAYFLDEFRDALLTRNDSLSRQELDARNSEKRGL